jgi:hypothetical protein
MSCPGHSAGDNAGTWPEAHNEALNGSMGHRRSPGAHARMIFEKNEKNGEENCSSWEMEGNAKQEAAIVTMKLYLLDCGQGRYGVMRGRTYSAGVARERGWEEAGAVSPLVSERFGVAIWNAESWYIGNGRGMMSHERATHESPLESGNPRHD